MVIPPPTNPLPLVKRSRHRSKAPEPEPVDLEKAEPEDETPVYTAMMAETGIDPAMVSSECDALQAEIAQLARELWPPEPET